MRGSRQFMMRVSIEIGKDKAEDGLWIDRVDLVSCSLKLVST